MVECEEGVLNWKSPMTLAGLAIDLSELAEPDAVKISAYHDCMGNAETQRININRYALVECYDGSGDAWELHYIKYNNQYSVDVKVCFLPASEPEPEPEPIPDDLTDYARIEGATNTIVSEAAETLRGHISNVAGGVSDLHTEITTEFASLTSGLSDLSGSVSGWIGDLQTNLTAQITGVTESLTGGFNTISDKIDGLSIPTLDSIKEVFLDVCADLASSLWDAILNKIEERYPKDEEESD